MPTFAVRRLAAYQAWWEHMPVRMARPESLDDITIYRTISWGGLADLIMLDGRKYRTNQACLDVVLSIDPPCPAAALPARTMLGAEQEAWLADQLASTTAIWPVIGQQTVLTDARLPNGAILNYDQWDGYEPARQRLLESAKAADRVIVLTGDIHLAGVGRLPGVGVEFVSTSISSGGLVPAELQDVVGSLGDIQAAELEHRGYTRHVVTTEAWTAEYRIVDDVADAASPVSTWKSFVVAADRATTSSPRCERAGERREHRAMALAIDSGPTDVALLDDTIAANLARTIAAHGSNEALVARHQGIRWTYDEFGERVDRLASGLHRARPRGRRPGRAVEPELRRVDAAPVRHGHGRRRARQHQPVVPHARAGVRARTSPAAGCCSRRRRSRRPTTWRWSTRSRARGRARWSGPCSSGRTTGTRSWPATGGGERRRRWPPGRRRCRRTTRSTSSTRRAPPGSRRAPRSPTATSSTTGTS